MSRTPFLLRNPMSRQIVKAKADSQEQKLQTAGPPLGIYEL